MSSRKKVKKTANKMSKKSEVSFPAKTEQKAICFLEYLFCCPEKEEKELFSCLSQCPLRPTNDLNRWSVECIIIMIKCLNKIKA
jgi:hypothetical protein